MENYFVGYDNERERKRCCTHPPILCMSMNSQWRIATHQISSCRENNLIATHMHRAHTHNKYSMIKTWAMLLRSLAQCIHPQGNCHFARLHRVWDRGTGEREIWERNGGKTIIMWSQRAHRSKQTGCVCTRNGHLRNRVHSSFISIRSQFMMCLTRVVWMWLDPFAMCCFQFHSEQFWCLHTTAESFAAWDGTKI